MAVPLDLGLVRTGCNRGRSAVDTFCVELVILLGTFADLGKVGAAGDGSRSAIGAFPAFELGALLCALTDILTILLGLGKVGPTCDRGWSRRRSWNRRKLDSLTKFGPVTAGDCLDDDICTDVLFAVNTVIKLIHTRIF